MPPAAPVMATVLPANVPLISSPQRLFDPVEIGAAEMSPIVEREFIDAAGAQGLHRGKELPLARQIRMRRTQDATQLGVRTAQAPANVEQVGFHAHGAGLIEAGLD